MRLHETCTCGSEIDIEHDDLESVRSDVAAWRERHLCGGAQPWRVSVRSTTASNIEFGFQQRDDEVMVRG